MLMEDLGFQVKVAYRADSALEILQRGEKVDLLFSDIAMPGGIDGIALAAEARRIRPQLPVLLTTGYSEAVGRSRVAAHGFPIVAKPYKYAVVGRIVLSLIERGLTGARACQG